jgi:predicted phosphodiesterase
MRYGLVTDIHNDFRSLCKVLSKLEDLGVDQIVTLGDTVDPLRPSEGADEVAQLLIDKNAIGVWGNHDIFFTQDIASMNFEGFGEPTIQLMGRMETRLELGFCHLSHRESNLDPNDGEQMWQGCDGRVDLFELSKKAFLACRSQVQLVGHYHGWWAGTPTEELDWNGEAEFHFAIDQRYFLVVAAVLYGRGAILDLESRVLTPVQV